MTHESFARYFARRIIPSIRFEDRLYIADWTQQRSPEVRNYMIRELFSSGRRTRAQINEGANFIIYHILPGLDTESLELFQDMDPSMYMLVVTKAVVIYTMGSKRNEEIPDFFKFETARGIARLRENITSGFSQELEQIFINPARFETGPQDIHAARTLNTLRGVAYSELQDSLFITRCWQRARELNYVSIRRNAIE